MPEAWRAKRSLWLCPECCNWAYTQGENQPRYPCAGRRCNLFDPCHIGRHTMKKAYLAGLLALFLILACSPQLPPPLGPTPTPTIGLLTQRARMDDPAVCIDGPQGIAMW